MRQIADEKDYDLRPINAQRLRFRGRLLADQRADGSSVRIYQTASGYVAEVVLAMRDDDRYDYEVRAYMSKDGDKLARILFEGRGGMERDDPDLPLIRAALDQAGIEAGREV